MSVTSLVTNGYICYAGQAIPVPQPATLDTPSIVGAVEVRPKIRRVTPPEDDQTVPKVTSAEELKPSMRVEAPPDATAPEPPKMRTAEELKPKIVSVEEED